LGRIASGIALALSPHDEASTTREVAEVADWASRTVVRSAAWLAGATLTISVGLIGLDLVTRTPGGDGAPSERWTVLVRTGDELAAAELTASPAGPLLTPGKAYLLAFHEAQDVGDLEHVLAVADRLDAVGETELAAHVRRAADALLEETTR
jgi:hypothetical protein